MSFIKTKVKGIPDSAFRKATERRRLATDAAVYEIGNVIMRDSKRRVPVDSGTLRGSGYVTLPERTNQGSRAEMGYGGPAQSYAEVVHENTSANHPNGGEAKYLENAINSKSSLAFKRAAKAAAIAWEFFKGTSPSTIPTNPDQGDD